VAEEKAQILERRGQLGAAFEIAERLAVDPESEAGLLGRLTQLDGKPLDVPEDSTVRHLLRA